jgi:hypothetical protein
VDYYIGLRGVLGEEGGGVVVPRHDFHSWVVCRELFWGAA